MKRYIWFLIITLVGCSYAGTFEYNEESVDPLLAGDSLNTYAFHLQNRAQSAFYTNVGVAGVDVNTLETIRNGITGLGIRVCVSDQGVDSGHLDLDANILPGESTDYSLFPYGTSPDPIDAFDDHGTAVAGLILAEADNGIGSRGLAPGALWASKNFISNNSLQSTAIYVDQATGNFDIFNYSWGAIEEHDLLDPEPLWEAQLLDGVTNGRAGKGAIFIQASGNSYYTALPYRHGNANTDGDHSLPYIILVGGIGPTGYKASYSSPGSSLWISGATGEFSYPNMVTTDRTGCTVGYSGNSYPYYTPFDQSASALNPLCSYTVSFNGTSASTPVVSGVVALMLEANPNLTWRDVKHILAQTGRKVDLTPSYSNDFVNSPAGHTWEMGWVTNSAGFHFHNYYGFGLVDTDLAVTISSGYTSALGTFTATGGGAGAWDFVRSGLALAIPDNTAAGVTDQVTVATSMVIEAVQLRVNATHGDISDLGIELTSPDGTKSILLNVNNSLVGVSNIVDNIFLTNTFYGEDSAGIWTIKLIDGSSGTTGTLDKWELRFFGY